MIWLRVKAGEAWEGFWVGKEVSFLLEKAGAAWKGVLDRCFGSDLRWEGLGKGFWVCEEVILLRAKAGWAWEEVLGG